MSKSSNEVWNWDIFGTISTRQVVVQFLQAPGTHSDTGFS